MCRLRKWCSTDTTKLGCSWGIFEPLAEPFSLSSQRNIITSDVVVPVSSFAGVCPLVTVCCVRKEMLFHSVFAKQGIFLILSFQSQQSQLPLEKGSRLLWRKIWLWEWLLPLRGLELLLFQCCFYLHEFTQVTWVHTGNRAHRKHQLWWIYFSSIRWKLSKWPKIPEKYLKNTWKFVI